MINISNSGAYALSYDLDGTLDPGNTLVVTASDSSGKTVTNLYLSQSGGESDGVLTMNFSTSGWTDGTLSWSGRVYSGGIASPLVASGIILSGSIDLTRPVMTLLGTATITLFQ
jgi:hypothetical protein